VKIVVLIDNTPDEEGRLISEHGLSMCIESARIRILLDTGLSGSFIDNAKLLGVDLKNIDFCFLSHGHNDHCGGLRRWVETIPDTKAYLSEFILHEHYFSSHHSTKHNLSIDKKLLEEYAGRFVTIQENKWIAPDIAAVFCHTHDYPTPQGNLFLTKERDGIEKKDDFNHEMALVFKTQKGLVVFSACSHNGAINIMKCCEQFTGVHTITHFIGGLHFIDCNKTEEEVNRFCRDIRSEYSQTKIITGHCTSDKAKSCLKTEYSLIGFFHIGSEFVI